MVDILETGSNWLQSQRSKYATRDVTFQRDTDTVIVAATIGRTEFEIDNGHGLLERTESRDFLVSAADLVLGGSQALPKRGDLIRETQDAMTYVFEVTAPGAEPAWRYSDPYRKTLRIHTKLIEKEAAA